MHLRARWVRRLGTIVFLTGAATAVPVVGAPTAQASNLDAIVLTLSQTTLDAGSAQSIVATITARTAGENQDGITVTLSSTGDAVLSSTTCRTGTVGPGLCRITIRPGAAYGAQTLTAVGGGTSSSLGSWSASAQQTFFQYAAPASMVLALSRTTMTADGASASDVTVTLTDAAGRGVAGEPMSITTSEPSVPAPTIADRGNGVYTAAVQPPPDAKWGGSTFLDTVAVSIPAPAMTSSGAITLTNPTPRLTGPLSTAPSLGGPGVILDGTGAPVVLKGVDIPHLAYPYYGPFTDSDYPATDPASELPPMSAQELGTAYEWGANYVRLMVSSDLWLNDNHAGPCQSAPSGGSGYDPAYQREVTQEVNLITSYGMLAVLDLHVTNPSCSATNPLDGWAPTGGLPSGTYPLPSRADADAFWGQVATTFAGNPLVGYELYNEPQVCGLGPGSTQILAETTQLQKQCQAMGAYNSAEAAAQAWVRGGTVTIAPSAGDANTHVEGNKTTSYAAAGMAEMYEDVRTVAPTSLVFLDANGFAWDRSTFDDMTEMGMPAVTDGVYVFHYYGCGGEGTSVGCQNPDPESCSLIQTQLRPLNLDPSTGSPWPAPVLFNEIGWPENATKGSNGAATFTLYQHGLFVENVIATVQGMGDGWSAFAMQPDNQPGNTYTLSFALADGAWLPSPDGTPAKAAMSGGAVQCAEPPAGYG